LRAYQSRRCPRGFLAETTALEDNDLNAVGREPPCDRASDYAAADYQSFHATNITGATASAKACAKGAVLRKRARDDSLVAVVE